VSLRGLGGGVQAARIAELAIVLQVAVGQVAMRATAVARVAVVWTMAEVGI